MEKHTVYSLLLMTCSACFLIQARTICQEVTLFIVGWNLLHQPPINKMHNRHAHSPISWRQSSHLGSLFPNNSSLCWQNNQQARLRSLLNYILCHSTVVLTVDIDSGSWFASLIRNPFLLCLLMYSYCYIAFCVSAIVIT